MIVLVCEVGILYSIQVIDHSVCPPNKKVATTYYELYNYIDMIAAYFLSPCKRLYYECNELETVDPLCPLQDYFWPDRCAEYNINPGSPIREFLIY